MEVKAYTGRVHMQWRALLRRFLVWENGIAGEFGVNHTDIDQEFQNYAMVAVRVTPDDKKHLKLFATGMDTPEQVREKFEKYLDLDITLIRSWEIALQDMDAPVDEETAPEMDTTDPE